MIQDAARRRYALPATLHQSRKLAVMYTDFFLRPHSLEQWLYRLIACLNKSAASQFAARSHTHLHDATIRSWPLKMLLHRRQGRAFTNQADFYQHLAEVHARIITQQGYANANLLLGFIRNMHPTLLADAKAKGLITVGDQIIAPAAIEIQQARLQNQRYPDWQDDVIDQELHSFVAFEKQTWDQLDHILCMSQFVSDGLVSQGIAAERITLLPYPMDVTQFAVPDRSQRSGPVTVGFVGAVNLRKGAPQFLHTARQFDPQQVRFVMVGQNHLKPDKLQPFAKHVEFAGRMPRGQIKQWLEKCDIFFFPSTCEGSAGAVAEAMAMGLPIVTTPNAGSQVRDGIEGFIVSCGDMDGYHDALADLIDNPGKRLAMGKAARDRAMAFDMPWYQNALIQTLESFLHQ